MHGLPNLKILQLSYILKKKKKYYVCIPRSFLVISVCSQGKTLCSPCILAPVPTRLGVYWHHLPGDAVHLTSLHKTSDYLKLMRQNFRTNTSRGLNV